TRAPTLNEKIEALGKSAKDIDDLAIKVYQARGKSVPSNVKRDVSHPKPKDTGLTIPEHKVFYACLVTEARVAFNEKKLDPNLFKDVIDLYTAYSTSNKRFLTENEQGEINSDLKRIETRKKQLEKIANQT